LGFALAVCHARRTPGLLRLPEELRREDEATCAGYGFHVGTDAFASCLQQGEPGPALLGCSAGSLLGLGLGL
jgi:hypothetical protein